MKECQKKESAGNCGRIELVLGTEANGDALSFCPGENVTHTENWVENFFGARKDKSAEEKLHGGKLEQEDKINRASDLNQL
jgi:hypothetical protein